MDTLVIEGWNLSDLNIVLAAPPQHRPKVPVDDPAILSYGRQNREAHQPLQSQLSGSTSKPKAAVNCPPRPQPSLPNVSARTSPPTTKALTKNHKENVYPPVLPHVEDAAASATLTAPFSDLSLDKNINEGEMNSAADGKDPSAIQERVPIVQEPGRGSRKRTKRGQKAANLKEAIRAVPALTETISTQQGFLAPRSTPRKGNRSGWRDGPFIETPAMANPNQDSIDTSPARSKVQYNGPNSSSQKGRRRRFREKDYDDQNGWATGEATDIQDMGDFDFEQNLSKFDKRKVFEEIRQGDTTVDEDRLVSFNRLPARLGTAGGKNLHHTENVLESPEPRLLEHISSDSDGDPKVSSGPSSLRNRSRTSTRKVPSRKGSALTNADPHMTGSGSLPDIKESKLLASSLNQAQNPSFIAEGPPRSRKLSSQTSKPSLLIAHTHHLCPCISPLQALELEQLAVSELGLTEEMMTENAAHGIADTAFDIVVAGNEERDVRGQDLQPFVVLLCGNHKTGSRTIAAGRHLRNHGAQVVLCVLGLEREDDLLESVRRQLEIYRSCGGRAIKQEQLMRTLRQFHRPTDLIVDALLGMHLSFDDLRTDDQAAYYQLVCWVNGSDADTLALDVPSGIDASTGKQQVIWPCFRPLTSLTGARTMHDDTDLAISAANILSVAAPKSGLLTALGRKEDSILARREDSSLTGSQTSRRLLVADIGISNSVWKKFGTRRRHGVDFSTGWITALKYHDGSG